MIPVRIEDVLPQDDLEYFLSSSHWIDALTPPFERHFDELAVKLRVLLNPDLRTDPAASVPTNPTSPPPRASSSKSASEPTNPQTPPPRAAPLTIVVPKQRAVAFLASVWAVALHVRRKLIDKTVSSLPDLFSRVKSEIWPAGSAATNQGYSNPNPAESPPSELRTGRERRGRRILRWLICVTFGGPIVLQFLVLCYLAVTDILQSGADAFIFQRSNLIITIAYPVLSLASILVVFFSLRRRPWAIMIGATATLILPLAYFAIFACIIAAEFGSPFSDIVLSSAIMIPLVAGFCCIPLYAFAVLVVMEHEPETSWFRSLWRPLVSRRPRWLKWFRVAFVAATCLVGLEVATHATVAEIRCRTPINPDEEKFMGGSWKVVENTEQPTSGWFSHFRGDLGIVWTFSRDHRLKDGHVDDGSSQFRESGGWLADNPKVVRWSASLDPNSSKTKLILAELAKGTLLDTYLVEELEKDSIRLISVDKPKSTIRLQRIGRVPFRRE